MPDCNRLHELDAGQAATRLAQGVSALASFLMAEQEGVRYAAAQALQSLLRICFDAKVHVLLQCAVCSVFSTLPMWLQH